ncbi:MAG TPA: VOC family protein [Burkholderiales bacterium]|nr:VOC family protein [Burkholderiales bacterium]
MAKLRHIAITVDDMEQTARFYEQAFDMKRVRQSDVAIMMSDGVMSLAIIHSENINAEGRRGLHHIGFQIDEMEDAAAKVEGSGGVYHGQIKGVGGGPKSERKYRDPNGIHFDIATAEHVQRVWCIPADVEEKV